MIVHVFTHSAGFIESFDLAELQNTVSATGLAGEYSTREHVEPETEPVAPHYRVNVSGQSSFGYCGTL